MALSLIFVDFRLLVLALISSLNGLCGCYILLRNFRSPINRTFFVFLCSLLGWGMCSLLYTATDSLHWSKIFMQGQYVAGIVIALSFIHFVNLFPFKKYHYSPFIRSLIGLSTLGVTILVFSNNKLVKGIVIVNGIKSVLLDGVGHSMYLIYFLIVSFCIVYILVSKYIVSMGVIRIQLTYIMLGCVTALLGGVFCNLILPTFNNHQYYWLGPYFTFFISLSAIMTIKLCDRIQ